MHIDHQQPSEIKGILAWIERTGNRLPDPVFIFFYCIAAVVLVSVILALSESLLSIPLRSMNSAMPFASCRKPSLGE